MRREIMAVLAAFAIAAVSPVLAASARPLASARWREQSMPLPSGTSASNLAGVSCPSQHQCVAVGLRETTGRAFPAFAETWDGRAWRISQLKSAAASTLLGVSCPAAGTCFAVGDISRNGVVRTLAERWNGRTWRIQASPDPPGAASSFLVSVSCPAAAECTATGFSATGSGRDSTLAERWNGHAWRIQATPNPRGRSLIELGTVSCPAARACMAVGTFRSGTFTEEWNGRAWRIRADALPRGARDGLLAGVSCTSATACTATGDYVARSRLRPLAERWNGSRWVLQHAMAPAGGHPAGLFDVSCTRPSSCTAVGFASTGPSTGAALAEHWNGRLWLAQRLQMPPRTIQAGLAGVSCSGPALCTAAGFVTSTSYVTTVLVERYS